MSIKIQVLQRHAFIETSYVTRLLDDHEKSDASISKSQQKRYANPLHSDVILERITDIIGERVGSGLSEQSLTDLKAEGKDRYERKIPPGFKDAAKAKATDASGEEGDPYGDLIIWKEIIKYAKLTKRPVIYVTRDTKEDWFLKVHGETISPLPALIEEIQREAEFYFTHTTPHVF